MQLNPHTFPLVAYPGPAPEAPVRGEADGWGAHVLAAPSDRLLCFVLSRRLTPANAPWLSCAWLEHADTGVRVANLTPTGSDLPLPALGLPLTKLVDAPNQAEHFTYDGALIPGLAASVPCGVPLRLILDNAYQSPRFYAITPAAQLARTHLLLEWYHGGPLNGVPYGRGLRQRFYLENGSVQHLDPQEDEVVGKDPDTGAETTLSISLFGQGTLAVPPVPAYLAQAFGAARAVKAFLAEGSDWRLLSSKSTATLGRQSLLLSLESREPLLSRGCTPALLPLEAYDPTMGLARGWRCGDESDTAPDYQPTGVFACEMAGGVNTGYVTQTVRDVNRYSPTFNTETTRRSDAADLVRCPTPTVYQNEPQVAYATRNNCQAGYLGSTEPFRVARAAFTSTLNQADADRKALEAAQAGAQANANSQGSCTLGRTVRLASIVPKTKFVQFDVERSDAAGPLVLTIMAQAVVSDTSGTETRQFTRTLTVPDGSMAVRGATVSFAGAVLVEWELIEIQNVQPSDYTY